MSNTKNISTFEFVTIMAMLSALGAMSIDAMLPALSQMGHEFGVQSANNVQYIVSFIFIGFALGQVFYGPLSDAIGRKMSIYISLYIFLIGTIICIMTNDFYMLLFGRFLQGLGASGPKIVSLALIRDLYSGKKMAQIMSFISMIFILIPAIAPSIGGFILKFGTWTDIFILFIVFSLISFVWFAIRQKETLAKRKKFNIENLKNDIYKVLKNKETMAYTTIIGVIFGVFISYLSTAEQIFAIQYSLGDKFPLYFAVNSLSSGFASLINAKLVTKYGMRYLAKRAILFFILNSFIFLIISLYFNGEPSILLFMMFCMISFFCIGILFGNLNALAMEPMGKVAGMAASLIGSISMLISLPVGVVIGQLYNNTVTPMIGSFLIAGVLVLFIFLRVNSRK